MTALANLQRFRKFANSKFISMKILERLLIEEIYQISIEDIIRLWL